MKNFTIVVFSVLFFLSEHSLADDFVELQCSGESKTVNSPNIQKINDAMGLGGASPFTEIYKINFDNSNPVIMFKNPDSGSFVQLEGGKMERHSIYSCKSNEFQFECNMASEINKIISTRQLSISRVDGSYKEVFAVHGAVNFNVYKSGVCRKASDVKALF